MAIQRRWPMLRWSRPAGPFRTSGRGLLPPPGSWSGPRPEHLVLLALIAGSGLLSSWNIGYAGYSTFYSTAARSMSLSWRALAFGAFDPGSHITLDKLSGFLVPQALSVRLFGFHPWSIALPQVIEGMVTVLACYLIGRRWRGVAVGLVAAAVAASTPMLLSMFGHEMEDGLLTMALALALLSWQAAMRRHRWTSLLCCAGWVAIAFQAKMLQAWIILPALAAGYLVSGPGSLRQRLTRGLATGLLAIGLSLSWMSAIQLVPAADRPYIDGSTNNNMFSMVFGFNGVNRLLPNLIPGAIGDAPSSTRSPTSVTRPSAVPAAVIRPLVEPLAKPLVKPLRHAVATPPGNRTTKLVLPYYASQAGWLYPAALAGLLFEAGAFRRWLRARRRRAGGPVENVSAMQAHEPAAATAPAEEATVEAATVEAAPVEAAPAAVAVTDDERIGIGTGIAVAVWLVLAAGLLTVARVPHVAYLATISIQLAVLAGIGLVEAARRLHSERPVDRVMLPALVLVQACWAAVILIVGHRGPSWLVPTALVAAGLVALALLLRRQRYLGRPALICAVLVALLAPTVWCGYLLDRTRSGSAGEAYVGGHRAGPRQPFQVAIPFQAPADQHLSLAQRRLIQFLRAHHGRHGPLMITDQWTTASSYILGGGVDVMTMGGFSGRVPSPNLAQLHRFLATGREFYALLTVRDALTAHNPVVRQDTEWIRAHCSLVSPKDFGGPSHSLLGLRLYSCYN